VVVKTDHAEALVDKLERRGHAVVKNPASAHSTSPPGPSPQEMYSSHGEGETKSPLRIRGGDLGVGFCVEYAYLGARVYQRLGNIIPLDVRLPASVTRSLAEHFAPGRADALDQTASAVIDRLNSTMNGQQIAA